MSERPRRPWWKWLLAAAALLLFVGFLGLRWYLASDSAAVLVRSQLESALGQAVSVESFAGALAGESRLAGFALSETPGAPPYLRARSVRAGISVAGLIGGARLPSYLHLDGVDLRLDFDEKGGLVTKLPTAGGDAVYPPATITDAKLTLAQAGREPFVIDNATLSLDPAGGNALTGTIDDPTWGTFAVTGTVGPGAKLSLRLVNDGAPITPALLARVPFVPPTLWKQLDAQGKSVALDLSFDISDAAPFVRYKVGFARAAVRVLQADRPHFVAGPASGTLTGTPAEFTFAGDADDKTWGKWKVAASMKGADGAIAVKVLSVGEATATEAMLKSLPFVPKDVWDSVQASGTAAVVLDVGLFTTKPDVTYTVDVKASKARAHVSAIDLNVGDVKGHIVVKDSRVTLDKLSGATASGTITADADLDFRAPTTLMTFDVGVKGVTLADLPKKWEFPPPVKGKISGGARLSLTIDKGRVVTQGTGKGRIDEATIFGAAAKPIELVLTADRRGFRFKTPMMPMLMALPFVTAVAADAPLRDVPGVAAKVADAGAAAVRRAADGVRAAGRAVASAERIFLRSKETTYLSARIALDDADLADLVKRSGVDPGFPVAGKVSVDLQVDIPVNDAANLRAYRLAGDVRSKELDLAGLRVRRLRSEVRFLGGVLDLENVVAELPEMTATGTVTGSARARLVPRGDLSVNLDVKDLPADRLAKLLPPAARRFHGGVSGKLRARVPLNRVREPAAWSGRARLSSATLEVFDLLLKDIAVGATLSDGLVRVSEAKAQVGPASVTVQANARVDGSLPFALYAYARGIDPAQAGLLQEGVSFSGGLDATARIDGSLVPLTYKANGELVGKTLRVYGLPAEEVRSTWSLAGNVLRLEDLNGGILGGTFDGEAEYDLARLRGRLALKLAGVDAERLSASLGNRDIPVKGRIDGSLLVRARRRGNRPGISASLDASSRQLAVVGVPARAVKGGVILRDGRAEYRLEGEMLAGQLSLSGSYPPPPDAVAGAPHGVFRLENARLQRLWVPLRLGENFRTLEGLFTLNLPFRHEGRNDAAVGRGRFEVQNLRYRDGQFADRIGGDVVLGPLGFTLRDVSGRLAGGQVRASVEYRFADGGRNRFDVRISQAEISQLPFLDADTRGLLQGPIDLTVRGTPGRETRGAGSLVMNRGKVAGVEVGDWRVPFDFDLVPARGTGEVTVRDSAAQVGHGRAQLKASLRWGDSTRLEGTLTLFDATLRAIAGEAAGGISKGRVTGRVDFGSQDLRSANDVTATVAAKLAEAEASQLPVLKQITPFLKIGGGFEATKGELKATLSGGVLRVSEFSLQSPLAQMIAHGNVGLNGRLDLDVTAQTSRLGVNPLLLIVIARALPPIGPVPVGLIVRASSILAERIVHLRVGGTVKQPAVRVEPIRLLSDTAVRYFLTRALEAGAGG